MLGDNLPDESQTILENDKKSLLVLLLILLNKYVLPTKL